MVRAANFDVNYQTALAGAVQVIASNVAASQAAVKKQCQVATTADVDITTDLAAGQTVDGETLVEGWRVLVWQNTDASENGIRIVPASGAAPRANDFDDSGEIVGALVPVTAGATHAGKMFRNTNTSPVVVDTDDITFELATSLPDHTHDIPTQPSGRIFTVDPGAPTYDDTDPTEVLVSVVAKFGIDGGGDPYFNDAGVTSGEEAALLRDPDTADYLLRSYEF